MSSISLCIKGRASPDFSPAKMINTFQKRGINLKEQWIKVTPAAHFREDFPQSNAAMGKPVIVSLDENEIRADYS